MTLNLSRPLCVFDLETTGLQITKDRIIQIGIVKIKTNGETEEYSRLINPEINIPQETTLIHGITNEMVVNEPTFKDIAQEITSFIDNSDLGGYNSNKFDIPVLAEAFIRAEIDFDLSDRHFIDVQNIFHKMEQRTLVAAYKFYCDQTMSNAHDALYDSKITLEVLKSQLTKYKDLKSDIPSLAEFSRAGDLKIHDFAGRLAKNNDNIVVYNFGKHKGKTIEQVMNEEPGYYGWMLGADFPLFTKQCLKKEVNRIKESRKKEKDSNIQDKLSLLQNKYKKK
jgi:DNA polymerase-3 subunit epsilon